MRHWILGALLLVALAADARERIQVPELAGEAAPWTGIQANDYPGKLHFVVMVTDRTWTDARWSSSARS